MTVDVRTNFEYNNYSQAFHQIPLPMKRDLKFAISERDKLIMEFPKYLLTSKGSLNVTNHNSQHIYFLRYVSNSGLNFIHKVDSE